MNNKKLFHKIIFINEIIENHSKTKSQTGIENITKGQGRVLAVLKTTDNIPTKALSDIVGISVSSLNNLLNKLEKNGYITKEVSTEDKRILLVKITQKGRDYKFKNPYTEIFDCLNEDEKEEFDKYLDKIINKIHEEFRKENPEKYERIKKHRQKTVEEYLNCVSTKEIYQLMEDNILK